MARVFPAEFSDLLSRGGARRAARLAGRLVAADPPFVALAGAVDPALAVRARAALAARMLPLLSRIDVRIPPETIWNQTRSFQERLPKVARLRTAYLDRRGTRSWRAAEELGVVALLRSASLRRFGEALCGRPLKPEPGCQILCYGPGDYMGPHHDHHPDIPDARDGYLDVHIGLAAPGVQRQALLLARDGHLTEIVELARPSLIAAYRLPFWHQIGPLVSRRGTDAATALRWVLLASFRFADVELRRPKSVAPGRPA
jgi:hypothetical protein